jgi:hypothetical protein
METLSRIDKFIEYLKGSCHKGPKYKIPKAKSMQEETF